MAGDSRTSGTSIRIPSRIFSDLMAKGQSVANLAFTAFSTSNLFPLSNSQIRHPKFQIASTVIGASIAGQTISSTSENVSITFDINQVSSIIRYQLHAGCILTWSHFISIVELQNPNLCILEHCRWYYTVA